MDAIQLSMARHTVLEAAALFKTISVIEVVEVCLTLAAVMHIKSADITGDRGVRTSGQGGLTSTGDGVTGGPSVGFFRRRNAC